MPPASVLSPLAIPFEPSRPGYEEYAPFDAIYNDGVPEGIVVGSHADHEVIHNIPDTAIEEIFPPSAAEAAELDAVDDFLFTMVDLSFLEEREEKTRINPGHTFKKRWETRRKIGLVGKPYMATGNMLPASHGTMQSNERKLVRWDRHRRAHASIVNKQNYAMEKRQQNRYGKRGNGMIHGFSKPIQQPKTTHQRRMN